MKFKKRAELFLKHLERWIDDNNNFMNKKVDQIQDEVIKSISDVDVRITTEMEKIYNDLSSTIDSRCDKLQNKTEVSLSQLIKDYKDVINFDIK
jgi:hypothetical protein